ncbi:MAG: hypothetical protein ACSLEY_00585 [Candidatus Saccharimonadales bacterium]
MIEYREGRRIMMMPLAEETAPLFCDEDNSTSERRPGIKMRVEHDLGVAAMLTTLDSYKELDEFGLSLATRSGKRG